MRKTIYDAKHVYKFFSTEALLHHFLVEPGVWMQYTPVRTASRHAKRSHSIPQHQCLDTLQYQDRTRDLYTVDNVCPSLLLGGFAKFLQKCSPSYTCQSLCIMRDFEIEWEDSGITFHKEDSVVQAKGNILAIAWSFIMRCSRCRQ